MPLPFYLVLILPGALYLSKGHSITSNPDLDQDPYLKATLLDGKMHVPPELDQTVHMDAETPEVTLPEGKVRGRTTLTDEGRKILAFQGIPFAKKTVRFQPPEQLDKFDAPVLVTDKSPPGCPQKGLSASVNEDCLYVSVYTPELPSNTTNSSNLELPVMFFIHGGSFTSGSSAVYLPTRLLNEDVVLAVTQYRVGLFGFFTTQTDDAPGNIGLMDQIMALNWTRNHIRYFGGDPDQITIFGESAGAASVSLLQLSPITQGMYRSAIIQSGPGLADWLVDDDPLRSTREMAMRNNCSREVVADLVHCMQSVSVQQLIDTLDDHVKAERRSGRHGFAGSSPIIQKAGPMKILEEHPQALLKRGDFVKVPTMIGCNRNEGTFMLGLMYNDYLKVNNLVNDTEYLANDVVYELLKSFHVDDPSYAVADAMKSKYLSQAKMGVMETMLPGLIDMLGVTGIKAATYQVIKLLAFHVRTWLYSFEFDGRHSMASLFFTGDKKLSFSPGVSHADELIYLFPLPFQLSDDEKAFSKQMVELWTNFAIYGNPTPNRNRIVGSSRMIPRWPQFNTNNAYLKIGRQMAVKTDFTQTYTSAIDSAFTTAAPPTIQPTTKSNKKVDEWLYAATFVIVVILALVAWIVPRSRVLYM